MSITFSFPGAPDVDPCDDLAAWHRYNLNLSNVNAGDLLRYLGLGSASWAGELPLDLVEERCRERLCLLRGNVDRAREERTSAVPGRARLIVGARAEGYCHDRAADLLELCLRARAHGAVAITYA